MELFNGLFIIKFIRRWKRRKKGESLTGDESRRATRGCMRRLFCYKFKVRWNFPLQTSTGTAKGGSIPSDFWPSEGPYWLLLTPCSRKRGFRVEAEAERAVNGRWHQDSRRARGVNAHQLPRHIGGCCAWPFA